MLPRDAATRLEGDGELGRRAGIVGVGEAVIDAVDIVGVVVVFGGGGGVVLGLGLESIRELCAGMSGCAVSGKKSFQQSVVVVVVRKGAKGGYGRGRCCCGKMCFDRRAEPKSITVTDDG